MASRRLSRRRRISSRHKNDNNRLPQTRFWFSYEGIICFCHRLVGTVKVMAVCSMLFLLCSTVSQHLYLLRQFNTNEAFMQGMSFGVPRIWENSPSSQSIANGSNSDNIPSSPIPTNINKIVSIETINTARNKNSNDSETTWWKGRADITNVSHPHLGARLWVTGNQEPLLQMIVNPSPERLSSYCSSDREVKNVNRTKDKILCPRGLDSRPTWGIEGKRGNAALLKVRGGIQEYLYNATNSVVGKKRNSKILCMVYTVGLPESRSSLKAISETWAHKCDGFFAASNETNHSLGAIDLPHKGPEEYANMWQKIRSMWAYAYDHYRNEYDFFHIAGDDTYIVVENLRSFLDGPDVIRLEKGHLDEISSHPSLRERAIRWINKPNVSRPLIFGLPCPHMIYLVFAAGGPGYTLNRAALEVFATGGFGAPGIRELYDPREDVFTSDALATEGVFLSHVLDRSNGWRFGESAEFTSSWRNYRPGACAKWVNRKFGLQSGNLLDSISKETSAFHLKLDKERLKKSNQTIATLIRRYHAILYDLC